MPGPTAIVTSAGRTVYRNARGQFISRSAYERELRRGPSGKFVSKAAAARQRGVENALRAQLGAPPAGKTWLSIASKYPDRFEDFLDDLS